MISDGLDYENDAFKYEHADKVENELEKGKYTTGSVPCAEHEKAETLRMLGKGSVDPYYSKKHDR